MSKLEENVNAILGIEKENIKVEDFNPPEVKKDNLPVTDKTHVDADYDTSRENYYSLIDKGQKAIDGILDIAVAILDTDVNNYGGKINIYFGAGNANNIFMWP